MLARTRLPAESAAAAAAVPEAAATAAVGQAGLGEQVSGAGLAQEPQIALARDDLSQPQPRRLSRRVQLSPRPPLCRLCTPRRNVRL